MKYGISVEIDDISRLIHGTIDLQYTNNSPNTLRAVYFRAAPNAFRPGSPRHRKEIIRGYNRCTTASPEEYGYCEIHSFNDESGAAVEYEDDEADRITDEFIAGKRNHHPDQSGQFSMKIGYGFLPTCRDGNDSPLNPKS